MNTKYYLPAVTYGDIKKTGSFDIAILPWGATEPHNGHLPLLNCREEVNRMAIPLLPIMSR